ncbi:M56 family metallopeptidase [Tautonia plasticadhaerens]|uniref:Regulatory protein BlaR1 n=1 Tax=Tautonia plasticadhaerens TaxID=2527974 RepID=A0A518H0S3_9BACT|nr:M56 family metallopeptidase [Tautonia plasticadhaerens]QDV34408.1 Regulatory protein BlaR1 [Tautonia plasticadhaerens]
MVWWFAETTMVVAGLAAVAILAGRSDRLSPAARHVFWLVALLKLVIPPPVNWPWSLAPPARGGLNIESRLSFAPSEFDVLEASAPGSPPGPGPGAGPEPIATRSGRTPVVTVGGARAPGVASVDADARSPRTSTSDGSRPGLSDRGGIRRSVVAAWLAASAVVAAVQMARILRFRRHLRRAIPAPEWLEVEAARLAERIGVRVPELCVVPRLGPPMIWCLGRPRLLLPADLVESLDAGRWRGILAHELAHLRRGDHWVARLGLAAGWLWWWSPLYWLVRRRLDAEAELACDAWVVWALPGDRVSYAEVLFQIGESLSRRPSGPPAPSLGIGGAGRFFERRLTMILRERVACRPSRVTLLGAGLLAVLSLPSWTSAGPASTLDEPRAAPVLLATLDPHEAAVQDDGETSRAAQADKAKELEALAKQMEALGKEMESKFGPEFEKKMEALGREMESKFGPDSEFAKQMESKFGPDSEFAKQMEKLGETLEARRATESLKGVDAAPREGSTGPTANPEAAAAQALELARERVRSAERMHELGYIDDAQLEADRKVLQQAEARMRQVDQEQAGPQPDRDERDRRIRQLESTIRELLDELRSLRDDEEGSSQANPRDPSGVGLIRS